MPHIDNLFSLPVKILLVFGILQIFIICYNWVQLDYVASTLADDVSKNGEMTDAAVSRVAAHLNRWTIGKPDSVLRSPAYATSNTSAIVWGPANGSVIQRGVLFTVGISYPIKTNVYILDQALHKWSFTRSCLVLKASYTGLSDRYYE